MTEIAAHKFHTLDAMRGVAAIAVAIYHYRDYVPKQLSPFCFASGYLAVDLFFLLSGFVIAFSYDGKLLAGMSFAAFARVRLIRLLPMVWFGAAIGAIDLILTNRYGGTSVVSVVALNALLLPYVSGEMRAFEANIPVWSLFFEMIANGFYAASSNRLNLGLFAALLGIGLIGVLATAWHMGNLNLGASVKNFPGGLARATFSFFFGALLGRTRSRWLARVPRLSPVLILAATAALLALPHWFRPAHDLLFVVVASPVLVMLAAAVEPQGRMMGAANWLAALSYPLYAIHYPIRNVSHALALRSGVTPEIVAVASLAATIPISLVLARFYDEPLRRTLRQLWPVPSR